MLRTKRNLGCVLLGMLILSWLPVRGFGEVQPKYKHPSFITGVTLLSAGVLLAITAGVLKGYDGVPTGTYAKTGDCPAPPNSKFPITLDDPCVYRTRIGVGVFTGLSIGALSSGAASMIYWGVKVNIP